MTMHLLKNAAEAVLDGAINFWIYHTNVRGEGFWEIHELLGDVKDCLLNRYDAFREKSIACGEYPEVFRFSAFPQAENRPYSPQEAVERGIGDGRKILAILQELEGVQDAGVSDLAASTADDLQDWIDYKLSRNLREFGIGDSVPEVSVNRAEQIALAKSIVREVAKSDPVGKVRKCGGKNYCKTPEGWKCVDLKGARPYRGGAEALVSGDPKVHKAAMLPQMPAMPDPMAEPADPVQEKVDARSLGSIADAGKSQLVECNKKAIQDYILKYGVQRAIEDIRESFETAGIADLYDINAPLTQLAELMALHDVEFVDEGDVAEELIGDKPAEFQPMSSLPPLTQQQEAAPVAPPAPQMPLQGGGDSPSEPSETPEGEEDEEYPELVEGEPEAAQGGTSLESAEPPTPESTAEAPPVQERPQENAPEGDEEGGDAPKKPMSFGKSLFNLLTGRYRR